MVSRFSHIRLLLRRHLRSDLPMPSRAYLLGLHDPSNMHQLQYSGHDHCGSQRNHGFLDPSIADAVDLAVADAVDA